MPATYIVLEREVQNFASYVNGHYLAEQSRPLAVVSRKLGVPPLEEFFSMDPKEAAALIEEMGGNPAEVEIAEEVWFEPTEGLKTVEALQTYLKTNGSAFGQSHEVLSELDEWHAVLSRAQAEGIRWHCAVDY